MHPDARSPRPGQSLKTKCTEEKTYVTQFKKTYMLSQCKLKARQVSFETNLLFSSCEVPHQGWTNQLTSIEKTTIDFNQRRFYLTKFETNQ